MQRPERNLVLIPSINYIDPSMQLELGNVAPLLIRIDGKTVLEQIISFHREQTSNNTKFIIASSEDLKGTDKVVKRLEQADKIKIEPVVKKSELGAVISLALEREAPESYSSLCIHLGDTLIQEQWPRNSDVILYDQVDDASRWSAFKTRETAISKVFTPHLLTPDRPKEVLVGLFNFINPLLFLRQLEEHHDSFYHALMTYSQKQKCIFQKVKKWDSVRYIDCYYQLRKRSLNRRFFNQIRVEEDRPVLHKTSQKSLEFARQVRWYAELPSQLRCYIPQVLDYAAEKGATFIEMEYCGYPTLGDMFVYSKYDLGIWEHAIAAIFKLLEQMQHFKSHMSAEQIGSALKTMYLEKTFNRIEAYRSEEPFSTFFTARSTINRIEYDPLDHYLHWLKQINFTDLCPLHNFSIIHGDLNLSNILYDARNRIIKLVDPRGNFGGDGLFGDYRYDIAKLMHSFNGRYEAIINDQFLALLYGQHCHLSFNQTPLQKCISDCFNKHLLKLYRSDIPILILIESLLFLSMIPLHSDHPQRQLAMLMTGIIKIARAQKLIQNESSFDQSLLAVCGSELSQPIEPAQSERNFVLELERETFLLSAF